MAHHEALQASGGLQPACMNTYMEHFTDLSRVHIGHLNTLGRDLSTFFMITFVVFFLPPMVVDAFVDDERLSLGRELTRE